MISRVTSRAVALSIILLIRAHHGRVFRAIPVGNLLLYTCSSHTDRRQHEDSHRHESPPPGVDGNWHQRGDTSSCKCEQVSDTTCHFLSFPDHSKVHYYQLHNPAKSVNGGMPYCPQPNTLILPKGRRLSRVPHESERGNLGDNARMRYSCCASAIHLWSI
ncbi:hypothetical protein EDB87DRAFT_1131521 [Lactarius vividus]|nr:hypothetical protein EDB87DRAFT_1131521 [Lactarius vividus]